MNILSIISIIIYTAFFIGAGFVINAERKSIMNRSGGAVLISLGWWSFCNSFFFASATASQAMFWHKLGSLGWCGFVAFTTYYFLALTKYDQKLNTIFKKFLFFLPMILLIAINLFTPTTSLAQSIVASTSGWGWTYQNSITSLSLWLYLIYVVSYFAFAFWLLWGWAKSVKHKLKIEMALKFIILDFVTIGCGMLTDIVIPLTNQMIPAIANVITVIFGVGYFILIYRYDIFNINLVISSDDILQTSNNLIFVIDENYEIFKYNKAVGTLLGYNMNELIGSDFKHLLCKNFEINQMSNTNDTVNIETDMMTKDGEIRNMLVSISMASDLHNSFLCYILSCQDVSKQMKMQEELIIERKKFEALANEYQKLSYNDLLTGLPNRRRFYEAIQLFEEDYHKNGNDFSCIFLDLDNFKHVNDLYGHKAGDELLKAVAIKLTNCVNVHEFVARLGGDEFMIVMHTGENKVAIKMEQIECEFKKKIEFNHLPYEIGISYGMATFSDFKNTNELMEHADEAMYKNKRNKIESR
ncbi:MAG: diguanylate cyclase [Erysipelotrichaceae bacterium]